MNILAFDTASSSGAVAILKDGVIVAHTQLNIGLTHSEQLLPTVDALMMISRTDVSTIDAIAITSGPGSFTGLRIGFSTAKGMALGLHKPLIPIPTLDVLAENGRGIIGRIVPIMNARRNQVYTAIYDSDGQMVTRRSDYQAIGIDHLLAALNDVSTEVPVYFTGDGVDVFADTIRAQLAAAPIFAEGTRRYVCADMLALLAAEQVEAWQDGHGMRVEPLYLRDSEAAVKWREAHPGECLED
ncbi:MAG: tRNA (adenosine(37)-N6)-threonylcarbamoyltransferase complex dimerization subunit type 1 TsaB [Peptococcaceae bacterium]|nr:tRNA (adenosine(37)-N6)-threonylcarbamoyltransferase complex dimerization subunit type 1 TsaB [Peptococcaceae bacterium]